MKGNNLSLRLCTLLTGLFFLSVEAWGVSFNFYQKQIVHFKLTDNSIIYFDHSLNQDEDNYFVQKPFPGKVYSYNTILPGWYSNLGICTNKVNYLLGISTITYFHEVPILKGNDLINMKKPWKLLIKEAKTRYLSTTKSSRFISIKIGVNTTIKTIVTS